MRILVTGANGQLGNEMQVLAKENPQHTYYFTDVQELDICDKQAVWTYMAEKQIELVVNCAAYTAVDKAEDNQELAYKLNCEAPKQLASAAQANGAAMIQVSTDYVFDGTAHAATSPSPVASIKTFALNATSPDLFATMIASIVSFADISTAATLEKKRT